MCNKRIRIDKYNGRANIMTFRRTLLILSCTLFFTLSCSSEGPIFTNDVVLNEYPKAAEAITSRDAKRLMDFINHADPNMRSLSWRALAKSSVNNPDSLLEAVISANEHAGWLGLSTHELSQNSLQRVRDIYAAEPELYHYSCEIFKRQGREPDLVLILETLTELQAPEFCASAAGRIISNEQLSEETITIVLDAAFTSDSPGVRRNLLYGFYRSPLNRPGEESDIRNRLREEWMNLGIGLEPATDQYMVGILGEAGAELFVQNMSVPDDVHDQQLLIEVIRALSVDDDVTESNQNLVLELLSHSNPTVVSEMLERLKVMESSGEPLLEYIYTHHAQMTRNAVNFVTALELLQSHGVDISPLYQKLEFINDNNPYLTNRILNIYMEIETESMFLERTEGYLNDGGIRGIHGAQVLTDYWIGLEDETQADRVRQLMRDAAEAGDRSVVSGLTTLLTDDMLVHDSDFGWLKARYDDALSENNSENISAFTRALESRFSEQYSDLPEPEAEAFRIPDWDRLYAMGTRPYWHLETEKGEIVIRLDPLSAPFTVSSVDSLTRAGAYNDVAFHRVVHNFVIQGGDVGRGDGFGGPGYRIPTEPSLKSFERGAVGIASSGPDTEGSQYFVMHQWKPHLDADYTLFGTVVRGMDVVDRIQVGDLVTNASISVH